VSPSCVANDLCELRGAEIAEVEFDDVEAMVVDCVCWGSHADSVVLLDRAKYGAKTLVAD